MDFLNGQDISKVTRREDLLQKADQNDVVLMHGMVHNIRDMSDFSFVILRVPEGMIQCVFDSATAKIEGGDLRPEAAVQIKGLVRSEPRAPGGCEVLIHKLVVLAAPTEDFPINLAKKKLGINLETELPYRPLILRAGHMRARFRIQAAIVRAFRDFLHTQNFTEIRTPKIVGGNAEGGTNVFNVDYFDKKAFLAQSPQFYKQIMVGVYERVFEVGPVFRAEKHSTVRHLNEYISMDFEMGFIRGVEDLMQMETACLRHIMETVQKECAAECKALGVKIPVIEKIPAVSFEVAKDTMAKVYGQKRKSPYDLDPTEEKRISEYYREQTGSDFVFITHYPSKKRPFYTMDDPDREGMTLSFDLLFRGMEVTTGGQRIHQYDMQIKKMTAMGLDPTAFESYLMIHKYGMPPHGGLGLGLERLCMALFEDPNIRYDALFPRDMHRIEP